MKQVAIIMIIITPFLVELVCFRHSVNHYVELEKRANCIHSSSKCWHRRMYWGLLYLEYNNEPQLERPLSVPIEKNKHHVQKRTMNTSHSELLFAV